MSRADAGSFVDDTHRNHTDIQQLHLDLVSSNFLRSGLFTELNAGRINLDLRRRRWVARNSSRNTTNAFDSLHWLLGERGSWSLQSFIISLVRRYKRRLDDLGSSALLWGLYLAAEPLPDASADLYYFGHRTDEAARNFDMIGVRYRKAPLPSTWTYEMESAY